MITPALLLFLAVVTVVYVLAGGIVLRWLFSFSCERRTSLRRYAFPVFPVLTLL